MSSGRLLLIFPTSRRFLRGWSACRIETPEATCRRPPICNFLEGFLPASIVVNGSNNVIHFFGNYPDYISIAPGRATFNLFSIINKDLSLVALYRAEPVQVRA